MEKRCIVVLAVMLLLVGAVSAINQEMVTYTSEEWGYSIDCPSNWVISEEEDAVYFMSPVKVEGYYPTAGVGIGRESGVRIEVMPDVMDEIMKELLSEPVMIEKYSITINNEEAYVAVFEGTMTAYGEQFKMRLKFVGLVRDPMFYFIIAMATPASFEELDKKYFEPIIQSFKIIGEPSGIVIKNLLVKPYKAWVGEELTIKFDVVNEGTAEKTEKIQCTFNVVGEPGEFIVPVGKVDYKMVTLGIGESQHIEFKFIPYDAGTHAFSVDGAVSEDIVVTEARPKEATPSPTSTPILTPIVTPTLSPTLTPTPEEGVSGFEAVFAIAGILAITYLLRRRK